MAYNFDCRYFSGYKPCQFKRSCDHCAHYSPVKTRVAIVSLEALGAVLRSTCLLPAIRRKFPDAHITWITFPNARSLLEHNPHIDRLIKYEAATAALLNHLEFDWLFAVDKSLEAGALAEQIKAKEKRGFGLDKNGVIRPFTSDADYQYAVGLDDNLKFFVNEKAETQQITETMGLTWERDPYIFEKTAGEAAEVLRRRQAIIGNANGIIGYNTGCSLLYPYKKFTVEHSIAVIRSWRENFPDMAVALLGGREDSERQQQMKAAFSHDPYVIDTPTTEGLRSGVLWMDTADLVLSGCSLGLHIAIALKKPVICWFGVSCSQEIDVYERGIKIQSEVGCSPCWRKSCDNEPKCFDKVPVTKITAATSELIERFVPA